MCTEDLNSRMAVNYLRPQLLNLVLFTILKGVQGRFLDAVDLLAGGTRCEPWKNRNNLSTLRFASHVGR